MRKLIKLIILLFILFFILSYYGYFSLSHGFSSSIDNIDLNILTVNQAKILDLGDSYLVSITTFSNQYIGLVNEHTVTGVAILSLLNHGNVVELSIVPLFAAIFIAIIVIIFPKMKKASSNKNAYDEDLKVDNLKSESLKEINNKKKNDKDDLYDKDDDKGPSSIKIIFVSLIIIISFFCLAAGIIHSIVKNDNGSGIINVPDTSLSRYDLDFNVLPDELTIVSIYYEITPNVDIEYIKYKIYIYDDDGSVINEVTEVKYDLSKCQSYKYRIEVGVVNYFKVKQVKFVFIEGKKKV